VIVVSCIPPSSPTPRGIFDVTFFDPEYWNASTLLGTNIRDLFEKLDVNGDQFIDEEEFVDHWHFPEHPEVDGRPSFVFSFLKNASLIP
jgi:hypothetical protein